MKLKRIFFLLLLIVFISCTTNPQIQETNTILPSQVQPAELKNSDKLSYAIDEDTLIIYSDQGMENWVYFFRNVKKSDPAAYENIIQTIHHIHLNEGISMIPESAFENMENVIDVFLPQSLICIGEDAFCWCKNIKEIIIPDNVITISMGAFLNCYSLERLVLPNNIQYLPPDMIGGCTSLHELIVPASVLLIDDDALMSEGLKRIVFSGTVDKIINLSVYKMPDLCQVVFLSGPPHTYSYNRSATDVGPFGLEYLGTSDAVIFYLLSNQELWCPNGETEWLSRPLVGISSLDSLPSIY